MTDKLIIFPYVKGVPEYALGVQEKIMELEGEDFLIAVDLPEGLEKNIKKAVKKLPRISLIVDDMGRAIPIIPTDAAIEAVRTSQEFNYMVKFLDAGLPLPEKKFRGTEKFYHIVNHIGIESYSKLLQPYKAEYQDVRDNFIALRLKEILEQDLIVLFICDIRHYQNILKILENPVDYGCGYLGSTKTCKVKEEDVWKISPEIPFIMSEYENNRECFSREDAILNLYQDDEINLKLIDVYKYARNLAITDGQLYPDLYNIIASAKYALDDDYAIKILDRAEKYPFTYMDSNCTIKSYIDYDLNPLAGQRILKIKKKLKIEVESLQRKENDVDSLFIFRFKRTNDSLKNERKFANYLRNRFFHLIPSEDYRIEEFQNGLEDGIAVRESVRYQFFDKIYVKKDVMINNTGYVVEFGSTADTSIFFDSQNYCVGTAAYLPDERYKWSCFTMLPDSLDEKIINVMSKVQRFNPLVSCADIAMKYSDFTYVFTNEPEKLKEKKLDRKRMKILPLNLIPKKLLDEMQSFETKKSGSDMNEIRRNIY